ncbi:hypothetical protein M0805_005570, partial [Coniferiporia weirii]
MQNSSVLYTKAELIKQLQELDVPILRSSDIRIYSPRTSFEGRFADVLKAEYLPSGRTIAVKVARGGRTASLGIADSQHPNRPSDQVAYGRKTKTLEYFRRECGIGWRIGQQNVARKNKIVPLYGVIGDMENSPLPALVMDYVHGGRILDFLSTNELSLSDKLLLLSDAAKALCFLHSLEIVHRDIRKENIVVEWKPPTRPEALLVDFGSSKIFDYDDETGFEISEMSTNQSETNYSPPEYQESANTSTYHDDKYGYGDIWSFACVAMEVICNEKPWGRLSTITIKKRLASGMHPPIPGPELITSAI